MVWSDDSTISICAQHPRTRFRLLDLGARWADRLPVACPDPGVWNRRQHLVEVQRRIIAAVPPQSCHGFLARERSFWSVNLGRARANEVSSHTVVRWRVDGRG